LARILPFEGRASLWKNEVYFDVPVKRGEEKAKASVKKGALAYWPMGQAFCIFYEETRPHSPVNLIGQITENLELFNHIKSGMKIKVVKA